MGTAPVTLIMNLAVCVGPALTPGRVSSETFRVAIVFEVIATIRAAVKHPECVISLGGLEIAPVRVVATEHACIEHISVSEEVGSLEAPSKLNEVISIVPDVNGLNVHAAEGMQINIVTDCGVCRISY
jgi:hypothetical protein